MCLTPEGEGWVGGSCSMSTGAGWGSRAVRLSLAAWACRWMSIIEAHWISCPSGVSEGELIKWSASPKNSVICWVVALAMRMGSG